MKVLGGPFDGAEGQRWSGEHVCVELPHSIGTYARYQQRGSNYRYAGIVERRDVLPGEAVIDDTFKVASHETGVAIQPR
jgi:hypothetical protein